MGRLSGSRWKGSAKRVEGTKRRPEIASRLAKTTADTGEVGRRVNKAGLSVVVPVETSFTLRLGAPALFVRHLRLPPPSLGDPSHYCRLVLHHAYELPDQVVWESFSSPLTRKYLLAIG